ncbi:Nucleoporin NDC1 [Paramyrothecium foliicola]|nr:Nucleoporin NDC1 [Paramyrothecium foliicola]
MAPCTGDSLKLRRLYLLCRIWKLFSSRSGTLVSNGIGTIRLRRHLSNAMMTVLWTWFPLGAAGFRTALIFGCGLAILILRIAQYHVGLRTTGSGWQILCASVTSLHTYETAFWYGLSSLVFSHVFLWSMSDDSGLRWVTPFSGDRVRLNERPLFLVCYLVTCALLQTFCHYGWDYDRINLENGKKASVADQKGVSPTEGTLRTFFGRLPCQAMRGITPSVAAWLLAFPIYVSWLRPTVWSWTLMFMRPFYNMPKTNILPPNWPVDIYLFARCIVSGTLLNLIWASGNTAFSLFMVQAPLKNGKPLTSESKDPNGSLLNGLKSKKLPIRCFAMWELALVAEGFDVRRQAIFDDIDRKDGPMWSQVYAMCMDLIQGIESRVDNYGKPTAPVLLEPRMEQQRERTTAPPRDDAIYNSRARTRSGPERALEQVARSPGSTPASKFSPIVKSTWKEAKDRMLSKEQQEAMTPDNVKSQMGQLTIKLLQVDYIGTLFRHDFRTRFADAVLGGPYVEPTLYTNAVSALSHLAVASLEEDKYGNVYRDVANIVRSLSAAIKKVDALKSRFPPHWTDVTGATDTPEVDEVLDAMRDGLARVLARFEPYSSDLRLTSTDIRFAKEAMAKPKPAAEEKEVEKAMERAKEKPKEKPNESLRGPRIARSPEMQEVR